MLRDGQAVFASFHNLKRRNSHYAELGIRDIVPCN